MRKSYFRSRIAWRGIPYLFVMMVLIGCCHTKPSELPEEKYQIETEKIEFTESAKRLENPNRGFYYIQGFTIQDKKTDYYEELANRYQSDTETALTLIEINLKEYRGGSISEQGLKNIDRLLESLKSFDKHLLLRFLYDWEGKCLETEPDTREIIQTHMKQLEPIFRKYKEQIFVVQGLFLGDCGEMHHSKFLSEEDIRALAEQMAEVTDGETFLAVRTPAFWRMITQISLPEQIDREQNFLVSRIGLYNDGMLGSANDCGTYGDGTPEENGTFEKWTRSDELEFQDILCRYVPMGGEVIIENPYNDLERAFEDMAATHVSYLNRAYDMQVFDKWAETLVSKQGCFEGMDGINYIERHMGYRLVIRETELEYDQQEKCLSAGVILQNVGFAPVYKEAEACIILRQKEGLELRSYTIPQDIRELTGGMQSSLLLHLHIDLPMQEIPDGEWNVYFHVEDLDSGQEILLGNEQETEKYGYQIGRIKKGTDEI